MSRDQFWLTKAQFSKIKPHLPTDTRGKARVDDRRVISGIVQVLKSGAGWVDAPPEYDPRKTLYNPIMDTCAGPRRACESICFAHWLRLVGRLRRSDRQFRR